MRKLKKGRKFGRERDQRKALFRSLILALVLNSKIETSEAKAKEISALVDKAITRAKKGDMHSRRILAKSYSEKVAKKLIEEIAPKYKERNGGYTRVIKLGLRKSDGAKIAIIELV